MTTETAALLRGLPALSGTAPALDFSALPHDPIELFHRWFDTAIEAQVAEPHAVTLATVDSDGVPDARTLLLKDVSQRGWAFAGPADSAKGTQLADHPVAALNFWWQPLVRAVRVRGAVVEASAEETAADLAARAPSARALVTPGSWRLWRLHAQRIEFWQGSEDRHHTRIVYRLVNDAWELTLSGPALGASPRQHPSTQ